MNEHTQVHRVEAENQQQFSRRQFIMLAGLGCGFWGAIVGSVGMGIYALSSHGDTDQSSDVLLATDVPPTEVAEIVNPYPRPNIISRAQWGAAPINLDAANENGLYNPENNVEGWRIYEGNLSEVYKTVVVHHSALYEVDDLSTVVSIQDLHMNDRGWADIGYHYLIGKEGTIFEGRQVSARGTHTESYNTGSLGVCFMGNFEEETPTQAQLAAGQNLLSWVSIELQLTHVAGHFEFNNISVCPGSQLYSWLDDAALQANLQRGIEGYVPPSEQQNFENETTWSGGCACCCS